MAIRIERPEGVDALTEFVLFHDEVYRTRGARWPAYVPFQLPTLTGEGPFARGRRLHPLVARERGRIVARALAIVDGQYQRHWNERLGHVSLFEALPDSAEASRLLLDAACEWLAREGAEHARAGYGLLDFPFTTDSYEELPPSWLRQNPPYYHALLESAGFAVERRWVDYRAAATPENTARWEEQRRAAARAGFRLVALGEVPPARRVPDFTALWNEAFSKHWGFVPITEAEMAATIDIFVAAGMLETTVVGYEGTLPVGAVWYLPDTSAFATLAPGRTLAPTERLNVLGIGVRPPARGRGLNVGMAAQAYLGSVARGATHVSYTLVLDDNWPSRRTAEKLGASVCAHYVTYGRAL